MVFRNYSRDIKLSTVKMSLRGYSLANINGHLDLNISQKSLRQWQSLYERTRQVIQDPALYDQRGQPVAVNREESQFILDALEVEPSLYLDEIQAHLRTIVGKNVPLSTIHNKIKYRLHLTSKKAQTVHPSQCPLQQAEYISQIGFIPSNHLVFLGKGFCAWNIDLHYLC
jgi:transposase-like protein